ncbi:hypothetical protein PAE1507a [Pyrobaculum aerophilum str. IM2]|uniref:Uncharacterized protein n=1 Tax=Pyrobaculum aerophilum (strain ATCC 51768 / DSM 7523 / JCM 9630 / CIP 104966 / NBRC 100827 / IM2) TaxID=178306 RepID=Q8ZX23_PYRAE|nr:hypothetical protein PAE1507a [Pyrobaculum aerophilum str. IM2]
MEFGAYDSGSLKEISIELRLVTAFVGVYR